VESVQLVMWYMGRQDPKQDPLPTGYKLRSFQEGDQGAWAALLNRNNQLGRWETERVEGELAGALQRSGQFFVENGQRLVACAGVYDRLRNEEPCWEIGWIANDPSEVGKGLGRQVAAAAVRYALALPERPIYLLTDDHRLPALKTYLKIGFVPDLDHPTYIERWQLIFTQLGEGYSEYNSAFRRRIEVL
jgi:mycothiol synthase